jgi:hypothetical protein
MFFGFSVGDFVALSKLITEVTGALQTVGGARSEYQELLREFESLNSALRHLDQLETATPSISWTVLTIKCAALSCRHPLEAFLVEIKKYDKTLGLYGRANAIKAVTDKLRWTFGLSDEVRRLQTYLNVHVGTINILLAEHGLERMDLNDKTAAVNAHLVRERLDNTRALVDHIDTNVQGQALLLRGVSTMLNGLYKLVSGDLTTSLQSLSQVASKVL